MRCLCIFVLDYLLSYKLAVRNVCLLIPQRAGMAVMAKLIKFNSVLVCSVVFNQIWFVYNSEHYSS